MNDERHKRDDFEGKSASEMLTEVGRLLLLLLLNMLKWLGRLLLRGLKLLLKLICKGLLWLIDATGRGIERLRAFWNDNDTQEKLRKLRAGIVAAGEQLWLWTVVAAKATGCGLVWLGRNTAKGSVWLAKKTVQGIIHLGPTLRAIGRGLKRAAFAIGRWLRRLWRGLYKWHLGRVRAWRQFRRNKGFKGLLIDLGNWLKGQLHDYIEEEPAPQNLLEAAPNDDDDDDLFKGLENVENPSKVQTFGHRIYQAMKRIVEDD